MPRRQWGVFAIKVPKDFGDKRLTWTIIANGQTTTLPLGVIKDYQIEPFKEVAQGNEPPKIQFDPKGPVFQGPPVAVGPTLPALAGQPVTLDAIVTDDAPNDPDLSPIQLKQPPIALLVAQVPRSRRREIRQRPADRREGRQDVHDGDVLRARRLHPARAGERSIGRGRRRLPVLLDERRT